MRQDLFRWKSIFSGSFFNRLLGSLNDYYRVISLVIIIVSCVFRLLLLFLVSCNRWISLSKCLVDHFVGSLEIEAEDCIDLTKKKYKFLGKMNKNTSLEKLVTFSNESSFRRSSPPAAYSAQLPEFFSGT